jgi:leader peptidase (prepilin peptidase) / N-methyltransferase
MTGLLVGAGVLGAVVGSFLNVVVWRLPRGESLVRPRSRCPQCATPIRSRHNVPVLAWLWLRGRCADCRAPIPVRYPLTEAGTAGLYVAVVAATGADADALLGLLLVSVLVPVALIDLEHRRIPNVITYPAAVAAVVALALLQPDRLPEHLIAGAAAFGAFLVVALAKPGGMGMGDVKLAGVLGLFLGAAVAPAILIALAAGSASGIVLSVRHGAAVARKMQVPFGPFLALGGVTGILAGSPLVAWYLATFV